MSEKQESKYEKAYSGRKFSYANSTDSWFKNQVIRTVEFLTGRRPLMKIYDELHAADPTPYNVWPNALEKLGITVDFDASQLDKIPRSGPMIFVANHPFGVVDGLMMLYLVTQVRKDYFLLINEVVSHEPVVKGHLLPVDFRPTEAAKATNIRTKERTTERLAAGEALVIFPSGAVATQTRFFGPVVEFPWRRFICTRIHETQATVVPIYFHGQNSWLFHFVSKFSMNLRLGLLLYEVLNKRNQTFRVEVGDPIPYPEMAPYQDRQALIDYLREKTMNLGGENG
jgi:putative hemolysin